MINEGYTKFYRSIVNWRWYKNPNTFRLFFHLIITANFEQGCFEGRTVNRGQRIVSIQKLSEELRISNQSIRTAIQHLKSTGEITIETTSKYSIITVKNYDSYQSLTNPSTINQQTTNKQLTNDQQQYKKNKKKKNNNEEQERGALSARGQFQNVFLSDREVKELSRLYPYSFEKKIERLSRYIEGNGKNYGNHFAVLLSWLEQDEEKDKPKRKTSYDINELAKIDTLDFVE